MQIGSIGDIPFVVSHDYMLTFHDYSRSGSSRWVKHDLIAVSYTHLTLPTT